MSPQAAEMLMGAIIPRLRSAIPRSVHTVGAEDSEELIQDGIAMAARMLHNSEEQGKMAPAASVAYYTIQHLRSGRRSTGSSRADVMAAGTQLDKSASVLSTEEEVGHDDEIDEPITLGSLLASERDDPSMAGARNVDWDEFLEVHDERYSAIVQGIATGQKKGEVAKAIGICPSHVRWITLELAADLMDHMGDQVIEDSIRRPWWRGNLMVDRERAACQADRRRG